MAFFDSDVSPCAVGMIDTVTAARPHHTFFWRPSAQASKKLQGMSGPR